MSKPDYQTKGPWKLKPGSTIDDAALKAWIHDLTAWCQEVRCDIRALEARAGIGPGDPGPPPPLPE